MERLAWFAAAGAAALLSPVRQRIVPVSKALATALFGGMKGIVLAAARGDGVKPAAPAAPAEEAPAAAPATTARKAAHRPAKTA